MIKDKIDIRLVTLLIIISLLGLWRVLSTDYTNSFWNFTPIGVMALFGGTYFSSQYKSYILPLAILFVSDLILMKVMYAEYSDGLLYNGWTWTYGSFLVMVWIGRIGSNRVTVLSFMLGAFLTALAHYIITDLGMWLGGGIDITTGKPYPKDWGGLVRCYALALPYFKNMLIGNLFFGSLLFGGFEWTQRHLSILRGEARPMALRL